MSQSGWARPRTWSDASSAQSSTCQNIWQVLVYPRSQVVLRITGHASTGVPRSGGPSESAAS